MDIVIALIDFFAAYVLIGLSMKIWTMKFDNAKLVAFILGADSLQAILQGLIHFVNFFSPIATAAT